jgi:hypothetical protein
MRETPASPRKWIHPALGIYSVICIQREATNNTAHTKLHSFLASFARVGRTADAARLMAVISINIALGWCGSVYLRAFFDVKNLKKEKLSAQPGLENLNLV